MPYSVKGCFETNEDMVQILLILGVLFTQNSKNKDLFHSAPSGSEPNLLFTAITSLVLGLSLFKMTLSMTLRQWFMRLILL